MLADEEHKYVKGKKAYIATTVGQGCIPGAEVCGKASEKDLTKGYGVFNNEAQTRKPGHHKLTVNIDCRAATKKAWTSLFLKISVIQCFLHVFIKIRDRALKRMNGSFMELSEKVWDWYKAKTKGSFSQLIRRLKQWAVINVPQSVMKDRVQDLCKKGKPWTRPHE